MRVVEQVISLEACCERAGLSVSQYYVELAAAELAAAEHCCAKAELQAYLASEGRYAPPRKKSGSQDNGKRVKNRQCGLVAANFFIPTPTMWQFRERAEKEATKQDIWSLVNLPSFDDWFLDWTTPKAHRGRRHLVAASSIPTRPLEE